MIRSSAWILLAGIFATSDSAEAQTLTFFREYDVLRSGTGPIGFTSDGQGNQYALIGDTLYKYDAVGAPQWTKQIGIAASKGAANSLAANAGGVFVAGGTIGALPGQTSIGNGDAFVRKYDTNGHELWTRQFGTPDSDSAAVIAADGNGVYVAGVTVSSSSLTPGTEFVSRFDLSGDELWTSHFDTGGATW
jgi:hypothetical protein